MSGQPLRSVRDVTLQEVAAGAGLAKSNVLRYFDSREAVFLGLLLDEWEGWLDEFEVRTAQLPGRTEQDPQANLRWIANVLVETLTDRPLLCDLFAAMTIELERNVSLDTALAFKRGAYRRNERFAQMVEVAAPELGKPGGFKLGRTLIVMVTGLWPYAHPTEVIAKASAALGSHLGPERFRADLLESVTAVVIGLAAD